MRVIYLVIGALLLSVAASAAPGINHGLNDLDAISTGGLRLDVEDLAVKVQGGYVRSTRSFVNGVWEFNRRWQPLRVDNKDPYSVIAGRVRVRRSGTEGTNLSVSSFSGEIFRNGSRYTNPRAGFLGAALTSRLGSVDAHTYYKTREYGISQNAPRIIDRANYIRVVHDESGIAGFLWNDRSGNYIDYDSSGRVRAYGDKNNNDVSFRYDNNGNLTGVIDVNGLEVITYSYESFTFTGTVGSDSGEDITAWRITSVTDYSGRQVTYSYNENHFLTAVTDPNGKEWRYEYDDNNNLRRIIDPVGRVATLTITADGQYTGIQKEDGVKRTYSYGGFGASSAHLSGYEPDSLESSISLKAVPENEFHRTETNGAGKVTQTWTNALSLPTRIMVNGETEFVATYFVTGEQPTEEDAPVGNITGVVTFKSGGANGVSDGGKGYTGEASAVSSGGSSGQGGSGGSGGTVTAVQGPSYKDLLSAEMAYRNGGAFRIKYDLYRNIVERKRLSDGAVWSAVYHHRYQLPVETTDFGGVVTSYEYDEQGNLIKKIEAKGTASERTTSYTWDAHGNLLTLRYHADENTVEAVYSYVYDDKGNVTSITSPDGTISFTDQDNPAHGPHGKPPVFINELGKRWVYSYDQVGNQLSSEDPLERSTTFQFNDAGDAVGITLPNTATASWTVNHSGKPLVITNALGDELTFTYDNAGRISAVKMANGATQRFGYTARGLLSKHTEASGHQTTFSYDGSDLVEENYPTFSNSYVLDELGRTIQANTQAENGSIAQQRQYRYDTISRPTLLLDAESRGTAIDYDEHDRIVRITDALGGVTQFKYDDRDNLISVTDPEMNTTSFAYSASDRLLSETRPEGEQRLYSYYGNGLRRTETNGKGEITRYSYDDANQLTKVEYFANAQQELANSASKTVTFSYNDLGLLTGYSDGQTSATYGYDALGRLLTVSVNYGPFTKTHSYTYHSDGRRKTYTNPELVTYSYDYTPDGDFRSLTIPGEGSILVTKYNWRAPAQMMFPGGTVIDMQTDGLLRSDITKLLDPGGNQKASRNYAYNQENHIVGINTEEGGHAYTLDELYRLTQATFDATTQLQNEQYDYDGVGNRIAEDAGGPWQYNANHQLQSHPQATYAYDANGHTTSKTQAGTTTLYEYDLAERMTAVRIDGGATLGQYTYDPFGRRLSKTVNGVTTWFHYDDTGLLAEYSASGQLLNEYQYRPGSTWMTNPLFKRDGATGKVHYYYNSHLGQPLKLFDKAGKITWAARSQAFGQTTVFVNETENNLRFPGQYEDGETGLFYNHHRYYDPATGLYIQEDPMGIAAGLNWYAYGFNNPLHWVDPLGLLCLPSWAKGALAGAAGGLIGGFVSGGFHGAIAGALFGAVGGGIQGGLGKAAQALGESVAAAYEKDVPKGGRYHAGRGALLGAAAGAVSNDALGPHGSQALAGFVGGTFGNPAKAFYAGPLGALGGAAGSFVESRIGDLLDEYASDCDEDKDKGDC